MPGLKDIAPSFKSVKVKGIDIPTPGISAEGIGYLFARFPIVRELIGGKNVDLSAEALAKLAPDAVAAIIATGCGDVNDPEAETSAGRLGLEDQLSLLESIIGETMPSGIGPFVERLSKTFESLGVESMSIPAGTLPSASKA
jgi:hypothetical protein